MSTVRTLPRLVSQVPLRKNRGRVPLLIQQLFRSSTSAFLFGSASLSPVAECTFRRSSKDLLLDSDRLESILCSHEEASGCDFVLTVGSRCCPVTLRIHRRINCSQHV